MRLTQALVQKVADHATKVSGGHFKLEDIEGDIGHGTRYVDGLRDLVWLGRNGATQAASYYFGIIEAYNNGTVGDLPDWLREISRELLTRTGYEKWHNAGMDAANSRIRAQKQAAPAAEQDKTTMKDESLPIEERRAAFQRHNRRATATPDTEAGHRMLMEAGHAQLGTLAEKWSASVDAATGEKTPASTGEPVRYNSCTITDYAFSRHLSPSRGATTPNDLAGALRYAPTFGYTVYDWTEKGLDGHPYDIVRMIDKDGATVHLYMIDYFTRVPCADCDTSYARHYLTIQEEGTEPFTVAVCDEHKRSTLKAYADSPGVTVTVSEPLRIGQH